MKESPKLQYIVREKIPETPGVSTLKLSNSDGSTPHYIPGQFITVYFPNTGTPEGKAYSISSPPAEGTFSITVKAIGEFSNRLCAMKPGDEVTGSLPYGYFQSESQVSDLVLVAGGIGVAPFRSMILDSLKRTPKRKIHLFQSARTAAELIFKSELEKAAKNSKNISLNYSVTREESIPTAIQHGRITADRVVDNLPSLKDPEFLLCGSIAFTRDLWKGLRARGVPEYSIYTEAFFKQ